MTIAILAKNLEEYKSGVENHFLKGMERYHKVEFKTTGNQYITEKYIIKPALKLQDVEGLRNYQLIKYGNFMDNPDYPQIVQHYEKDLELRKIESPSLG